MILNALADRGEQRVLILDDYHTLTSASAHVLIGQLIAQAPAVLQLVIAGRDDPPLPIARLRAAGQLRELRMADLAFQGDETAALLRLVSGRALTPA